VERNRVKRWLREIVRRELLPRLDSGGEALDLLVRARRESYDASFRDLKEEILRWLDRRGPRGSSSD
jgi:ribonuclease P protein component